MPSPRASSSIADSTAKMVCVSPYPRKAPAGTVFVYAAYPSIFLFGQR